MIFLSVKFEKEDSSDFEKVKDFFLQKSQPGMESQWTIENIKFAPTCIISSREVPRLGDSPLRGGRADIMMKLSPGYKMSSLSVTIDLWWFTWGQRILTDHL